MRMHSKMDIVVLDGMALDTILRPFRMDSFSNVSFMIVDNSFAVKMVCVRVIYS